MAVDFKVIGQRIKTKRKEKYLTQENMAEQLGVSVGYFSNLERGTTKINLTTLSKIADILECDTACLISETSTGNNMYLNSEFAAALNQLNEKEKNTLLELINAYIKSR